MRRFDSVDVLRAIAIALMVPCHFLLFLSPSEGAYSGLYSLGNEVLGGLAAPLFLLLVGVSQAISVSKKPVSERLLDGTGVKMLKRGALIFVLGLLFQIPIEGNIYEWDVLPLIGAAIVALTFLRKAPSWALVAGAAAIFLVTPWLRGQVGYLHFWAPATPPSEFAHGFESLFMDPLSDYTAGTDPRLSVMAKGFFVTGYFPVFPWILFPLVGFAIGRESFKATGAKTWSLPLGIIGLDLTLLGTTLALYADRQGVPNFETGFVNAFTYFPASPPWLLVQLGTSLLGFAICRAVFDARPRAGALLDYGRLLSRYSFTIYGLHYLVAYWPPRIAEILSHDKVTYIGNWISPLYAWMYALLALIAFNFIFRRWDKAGGKFSMEWFLAEPRSNDLVRRSSVVYNIEA